MTREALMEVLYAIAHFQLGTLSRGRLKELRQHRGKMYEVFETSAYLRTMKTNVEEAHTRSESRYTTISFAGEVATAMRLAADPTADLNVGSIQMSLDRLEKSVADEHLRGYDEIKTILADCYGFGVIIPILQNEDMLACCEEPLAKKACEALLTLCNFLCKVASTWVSPGTPTLAFVTYVMDVTRSLGPLCRMKDATPEVPQTIAVGIKNMLFDFDSHAQLVEQKFLRQESVDAIKTFMAAHTLDDRIWNHIFKLLSGHVKTESYEAAAKEFAGGLANAAHFFLAADGTSTPAVTNDWLTNRKVPAGPIGFKDLLNNAKV